MDDLTICSVSFRNRAHLELNHRLVEKLNANGGARRWLIAENTPPGEPRLDRVDKRFDVRDGVDGKHTPNYQHTVALNSLLREVRTRFLLVLDPDFFLVLPSWHRTILEHMQRRRLTFFGVPWHPRHGQKYRYFPCVHCFFVDLERVPAQELDFRPTWSDAPGLETEWRYTDADFRTPVERLWFALLDRAGLRRRRAQYCDSGTRMYWKFRRARRHRHEVVQAVMRDYHRARSVVRTRMLEAVLPDEYCYRPKRRGYVVATGLREFALLQEVPAEWEEFMWDGRPFGFHLRRHFRRDKRPEAHELGILTRVLHAL